MKVIIFTAEPSNYVPVQLERASKQLGHEVEIIDATKCVLAEGDKPCVMHLVDAPVSEGEEEKPKQTLGEITISGQDTIVIPRLNEHHLEMKLSALKRFQLQGAELLNTVEGMALCNDKLMSQVVLNTAGIHTPFSFTVRFEDLETITSWMEQTGKLKYPVIVKTLRGTHGIGVMRLDSKASLTSVCQMLLSHDIEFMVQEYLEHDQSARIIMIGDQVLAANLRGQPKDTGEFRTNAHLGSETKQYVPSEEEVQLCKKIVDLFGCRFCAIDYIIQGEGEAKKLIVLEVNGSPGLENIQSNWPEKDLAKGVISYATRKELDVSLTNPDDTKPEDEKAEEPEAKEPTDSLRGVELVTIDVVIKEPVEARIDTGAKYSSIHVDKLEFDDQWTRFTRGDSSFRVATARTIKIKNVHGDESTPWTRRPMVKLTVSVHGKTINGVEFSLNNRASMKYEVLLGRNVIEPLGLPVVVDSEFEDFTPEVTEVEEE